jgi:hypothetical protein
MRNRAVAVLSAAALLVALAISGPAGARADAAVPAVTAVTADGTLTVTTANPTIGTDVTLHYRTDAAQVTPLNWVAIYDDPSTGPINQVYSSHPSTDYRYVTDAEGDVSFDTSGLTPGTKIAYFLADDGYQWLATPVAFTLLATGAPTTDGTLALTSVAPTVGDQLTFSYATSAAEVDPLNWVGVYDDPAEGPLDQTFHGGSTVWTRATEANGTVTLDSSGLTPGAKVAYFLAQDGYNWLARPVSFFIAGSTSGGPNDDGILTLTSTDLVVGAQLTFHYETDTPDSPADLNWVGLYDNPADGPTDQTFHAPSTVWSYVSGTSGEVTLDSSAMSPGTHTAYFLYNDGYTWLAPPLTFTLTAPPPPVLPHFVTDDFSAGSVHTGALVRQSLAGLWVDPKATSTTFAKTGGAGWLKVSAAGVVSGRTPQSVPAHPALVQVTATDDAGGSATVTVEVSVYRSAAPPALKVASWNLWDAGSHVDGAPEKELRAILTNGLDVIGVQESGGTAAKALATALGWASYQSSGDLGIVSRYPISHVVAPTVKVPAAAATVQVGNRAVRVWTAHLDEADYGPYAVCLDGVTPAHEVTAEKATTRYAQAKAVAAAMASDLRTAATTAVVLLGDLASPSDLDWTKGTAAQHCGAGALKWPVTQVLAQAGLADSYRVAHSSPRTSPGPTWSPVLTTHPGGTAAEPQDRIDYVDFAGALDVVESHALVTGFPAPEPDVGANSWTSDHAAAVTTFSLR